jgi:fibro-slime domain-containing protein
MQRSSLFLALFLMGCVAPATTEGGDPGGSGASASGSGGRGIVGAGGSDIEVGAPTAGGTTGEGTEEDCDAVLEVIYRDFNSDHPDFEATYKGQDDVGCGIVMPDLDVSGGRRLPAFRSGVGSGQRKVEDGEITCIEPWPYGPPPGEIESAETFADWYRDTPGVNLTIEGTLPLSPTDRGTYVFDSAQSDSGRFFPLDGLGFNELMDSQGQKHNFHFTTEAHVRFGYKSKQTFTFSGDDDLWIFVNGKLALDLGGLHGPITATLDFDALKDELGIVAGRSYNMDIFHAERHTDESNFRIETNISCFESVPVVR